MGFILKQLKKRVMKNNSITYVNLFSILITLENMQTNVLKQLHKTVMHSLEHTKSIHANMNCGESSMLNSMVANNSYIDLM